MICNCYFERSYWRWSWWSYKENIILGAVLFLPLTWLHTSGCRLYVYRLIDHPACLGVKGECRVPVLWCYLSVFDSGPPADSGCPQKCRCRCAASPPLVTASDSGWSCSCWLPVCSAYNCSIWKWRGTWIKKKGGGRGGGHSISETINLQRFYSRVNKQNDHLLSCQTIFWCELPFGTLYQRVKVSQVKCIIYGI